MSAKCTNGKPAMAAQEVFDVLYTEPNLIIPQVPVSYMVRMTKLDDVVSEILRARWFGILGVFPDLDNFSHR